MKWSSSRLFAFVVGCLWLAVGQPVVAEEVQSEEIAEDEGGQEAAGESERGIRHMSRLQLRVHPLGLSHRSDTAFRMPLWDSDQRLLDGTYIDSGVTTALSPAYLWGGPFVEALPLAVLNLRAAAYFKGYFGTFGHLHVDADGDGSREARNRTSEQGLAQSTTGWRVKAQATPQMLIGRVVMTAETTLHRMVLDVEHPYYEPSFGLMFEPRETIFETNPTVGYVFGSDPSKRYTVIGVRWERTATWKSEQSKDKVGVVWNVQLPSSLMQWGSPEIAGFAALRLNHPERRVASPFLGVQFTVNF